MKKLRTLTLVLALAWGIVPSGVIAATDSASEVESVAATDASSIDREREIELLRAQLEVRREHQTDLLQTVYWALGGVFFLVSLLVGFGWFGNFKVYERDKQSLKEEMDAAAKANAKELHDDIQKAYGELKEQIYQSVENKVEARFKEVDERIKRIGDRVLQLELARAKEEMRSNASDNMALTSALNLLGNYYKTVESEVPELLKFIIEKLDKGGKFTANEHTRMSEILDDLPPRYFTLTERVRKKMNDSEIF
ncbi:hypothetical protein [Halopseudomonas salegens]|uniref:Uncharacterized protein n=1 Tax=Halopseudomonas salegens TaxID=1434072 RepID=A0A1H2FB29_9GAMM|nr:hypothetical protein [Halopseudomonas salegens]SDU04168.1 hypothetical protein SAMN05216210_1402 [Halopseudomonas salegens]